MLITKIIETALDIDNPIYVCSNKDNIQNILASTYEGKCYSGCWIKQINHVICVGDFVVKSSGSPDCVTVPVKFEVTGVIFTRDEVVTGCTIVNKHENNVLICRSKMADIYVGSSKLHESFIKGQLVNVIVLETRYSHGSDKISVYASVHLFKQKQPVYHIDTRNVDWSALNHEMNIVASEEELAKQRREKQSKAWNFFDNLLYAYSEQAQVDPDVKIMSIKDIVENKTIFEGYLSRDSKLKLSEPNVCAMTEFTNNAELVNERPTTVIMNLLADYHEHLRIVREMIDVYSTESLIKTHSNLWRMYKKNKM